RKRTCYLCSLVDDALRKFPSNSREAEQKRWIVRLGLSAEETKEKLADYRKKIDKGTDIRWCSEHFDSPVGLPKDAGLATPPPILSPARPSSPLRVESLDLNGYHNDEMYYGDMATLPKRFKTQSSIRTETTMALSQGSEYVPSSQSGEESEESDDDESDGRGETKFRIVGHEELLELFHRCKECGKLLDRSLIRVREEGGACTVEYDCLECGTFVPWQSQRRIGKGKSTVFEGNQSISIAAFITGVQIPRFNDFGKLIGLGLPSERAMRRAIRDIGCPAIEKVFMIWQRTVRQVSKDAAEPDGISVAIDGQYDNPGWNGSNCKATVMDAKTKLAIAGCSVHKKEPGIDGVSIRMESTGILRAMEELIDDGFVIKTRVSDRNKMVDKKLREHPKTKSIVAENDWWHTQKPLKKEWWRAMKNSPIIAQLYCPFFNHIFYCHKKFPKKEERPKALELVRSFLMHVQGKHRWKKGKKFQIITKCDHEKLKRRKKGDPPRPILKILVEGVRVREQLDDTRVERRLGVPSDLVFDEICSWYEKRNEQEEEIEGEKGEECEYDEYDEGEEDGNESD
ncbi:hypothetical protein PMAYCL1PPCAC_03984, partial [Pristionchus mayeri]